MPEIEYKTVRGKAIDAFRGIVVECWAEDKDEPLPAWLVSCLCLIARDEPGAQESLLQNMDNEEPLPWWIALEVVQLINTLNNGSLDGVQAEAPRTLPTETVTIDAQKRTVHEQIKVTRTTTPKPIVHTEKPKLISEQGPYLIEKDDEQEPKVGRIVRDLFPSLPGPIDLDEMCERIDRDYPQWRPYGQVVRRRVSATLHSLVKEKKAIAIGLHEEGPTRWQPIVTDDAKMSRESGGARPPQTTFPDEDGGFVDAVPEESVCGIEV